MATKKVNIDIVAKDKSQRALKGVRNNLDGVKKAVFNVRNAFIGLGAGLVIRNLVNTGKELENLQVRLKFLLKDTNEGAKAFDNMVKFASKVPFSLEEIQSGSGILATVTDNAEDLQNMLEITGNVAAVTGLDFRTAAEQIQRSFSAGIGAADLFREKGVRNMLGFKAGATVSIEETVQAFEKVFSGDGRFANSTDELAKTFTGTLSMINDKIFTFKKDVLEAGFFPELKKQFGDLDKFLADNSDTIKDIAVQLGEGLAKSVVGLSESVKFVADNFKILKAAVSGFVAFKLAGTVLKIASALRKMQLTLIGITALSGPRGLGLVALSIGAMTTAAMLLPDPLEKTFNEFSKLTKPDLKKKINEITEEIKKLEQQNKQLEDSLKDLSPELELPDLDLDGLEGFKDQIIEIPDLYDGMTDSMLTNSETIAKLKTELEMLNKIMDAHSASALEIGNSGSHMATIGEVIHNIKNKTKENEKETKKLIETHGILDNDLKDLFPTLTAHKEAMNKIGEAYEFVDTSLEDFLDKEKQLKFMNEEGIFSEDTFDPTHVQSFITGFKNAMKEGANAMERFNEAGQKSFQALSDTLTDFVMTGKLNFQDFARTVTRLIIEALIGSAIQSAVAKSTEILKMDSIRKGLMYVFEGALKTFASIPFPFNIAATGAAIGFGMNLVKKIQGFEKGGRPPINQPSIVGEGGPELFVPNSAGTIIPNNMLGGGQPVNVNFNINTVDARGFNELLVNSRGVIVNMINSAVNEKGRQAII